MTREEALIQLKGLKELYYGMPVRDKVWLADVEALDIAIRSLEYQESYDCISREWIKTAIHNFYYGQENMPTEEDIQAYLDVAPNVQPKTDRVEYGTDRNPYKLSISNGKEYEQKPSEDCISREMVIDYFKHWYSELLLTQKEETDFCDIVKEMPSVQPKVKTDILDKIKAEIRNLDDINPDYPMDRTIHISRNEVLSIIDKYKQEE